MYIHIPLTGYVHITQHCCGYYTFEYLQGYADGTRQPLHRALAPIGVAAVYSGVARAFPGGRLAHPEG